MTTPLAAPDLRAVARSTARRADANRRAFVTLTQSLAVTAVLALLPVLSVALYAQPGTQDWAAVGWSALSAVGLAVLAYLHRTVLDPSRIPSLAPGAALPDHVARGRAALLRTARTVLQGVALTALVALVPILQAALGPDTVATADWRMVGITALQAAGTAVVGYVQRAFGGLPPADTV